MPSQTYSCTLYRLLWLYGQISLRGLNVRKKSSVIHRSDFGQIAYLYCIFGLGLLVVVSSIGRILIFEMINRGKSMSYDLHRNFRYRYQANFSTHSHWKWIFVLTALEIDIAITLASLPYLGPLIRGCLPIPSGPGSWEPDILSENHPMQADDWLRGSSKSEGVAHCSKMEQGSESSTNNDIELDA